MKWISLVALCAAGCVHASDIDLKNPLVSHAVDANRIVKDHGYAEQARGLPPGALADEATLLAASPSQLCFGVTMRELAPIDLRDLEVSLSAPKKDELVQAQMWPEPTQAQVFDGLIPEQRET